LASGLLSAGAGFRTDPKSFHTEYFVVQGKSGVSIPDLPFLAYARS
jgi:hypothetical protein